MHALAATVALLALGIAPGVDSTEPPTERTAWALVDLRPLDVDGVVVSISPDGQWLAGIGPDSSTFCVWDVASLVPDCHDVGQPIAVGPLTTMAWAPDSSAVAFDLDFLVRFVDSDVYVYETDDSTVVDLTDDGFEGGLLDAEDVPADLAPTWSPDGSELAFARSRAEQGAGTTLMRVGRDGGEPVEILTVPGNEPVAVWSAMHWLADDSIVFSLLSPDPDDPQAGVWRVGTDGTALARVLDGTSAADVPQPLVADVSADGATASVASIARWTATPMAQLPVFSTLDLATSAAVPLPGSPQQGDAPAATSPSEPPKGPIPSTPAAFSPNGALALVGYRALDDAQDSFRVLDLAAGTTSPVDAVPTDGPPPTELQWTADDTVLLLSGRSSAALGTLQPTSG
jgi:hypothetical protein